MSQAIIGFPTMLKRVTGDVMELYFDATAFLLGGGESIRLSNSERIGSKWTGHLMVMDAVPNPSSDKSGFDPDYVAR